MKRVLLTAVLAGTAVFSLAAGAADAAAPADDVIARVGDQPITFGQLNTMLNSSAVVGVSLPALGTPERDTVRIALLDKVVSANLIYLDARRKGIDQTPLYRRDLRSFEDAILTGLYGKRHLMEDTAASEAEIQAYYQAEIKPGTVLDDDLRTQIEATLRKRKVQQEIAAMDQRVRQLREGLNVVIHESAIDPNGDAERSDDVPVATVGPETLRWGDVKSRLMAAGKATLRRDPLAMEDDARLDALQVVIDTRVVALKARQAGLDQDPVFLRRVGEYGKTRLINLHRAGLAAGFDPDEQALQAFFTANRARITIPESRKVQMVVLASEAQAMDVKQKIESGQMTMYQAALEYSVTPTAKLDLGEIGWVNEGTAFPELDKAIFFAEPDEVAGPVQSPAGWHLVKVQDVREARFTDLENPVTRKRARRMYIHDKLDAYVVNLRKTAFPVEVYEDKLTRLAQQEADMVRALADRGQAPGSVTKERIEQYQKMMK